MKSYWIIGLAEEIEQQQNASTTASGKEPQYFHGCKDHIIDGQDYIITPLTEIARVYEIRLSDFLDDIMLDALNKIRQKRGYYPILTINEDE